MQAIDIYFPMSTVLELTFYVGLLKVAEQMKNPFGLFPYITCCVIIIICYRIFKKNSLGDDDEDFDLNFLLNRHFKVISLSLSKYFLFMQYLMVR